MAKNSVDSQLYSRRSEASGSCGTCFLQETKGTGASTLIAGQDLDVDELDLDVLAFIRSEVKKGNQEFDALWKRFQSHVSYLEAIRQTEYCTYVKRIFTQECRRFCPEEIQQFVDAYTSDDDSSEDEEITEEDRRRNREALKRFWEGQKQEAEQMLAKLPAIERGLREQRDREEKDREEKRKQKT